MKNSQVSGVIKALNLQWLVLLTVLLAVNAQADKIKILQMGDTQYILNTSYSGYPEKFVTTMSKIPTDPVTRDAAFFLHMGDLIETGRENNIPRSYDYAEKGIRKLDGKMPYVLNVGNNDVSSEFNKAFPLSRYKAWPSFVANKDNHDNVAHAFEAGGVKWLVISLMVEPSSSDISWAENLIKAHTDKKVIIVNHDMSPAEKITPMAKKYRNVVFLLAGHTGFGRSLLTGNNGNKIGWIKTCPHDKKLDSYLAVIEVDTKAGTAYVRYYSTLYGKYWDDPSAPYYSHEKRPKYAPWTWSGFDFGGTEVPNVSITSPANNSSYDEPANITVKVNASDNDGSITKVELRKNGSLAGTDYSAPYSFNLTGLKSGSYTLQARAYDNQGATKNTVITVKVNGPAGEATLEAEHCGIYNGSINSRSDASGGKLVDFSSGGKLTCGVSSPAGTYNLTFRIKVPSGDRKMGVFVDNSKVGTIGTNSTSWVSTTISNVNLGNTIEVRDTEGTSELDIDKVDLKPLLQQNRPPVVNITSPSNGTSYNAPATVTVNVSASDPDGNLSRVDIRRNGYLVSTDNTAPYVFTLSNLAAGSYTLQARAIDTKGLYTNKAISITVKQPTSDKEYLAGHYERLPVTNNWHIVDVTLENGTLWWNNAANVRWSLTLAGDKLIAGPECPYGAVEYQIQANPAGSKNVTGLGTGSEVYTRKNANQLPNVNITSPSNGKTYVAPASVRVNVSASDPDGNISKVELRRNGSLAGTDNTAPYSFNLNGLGQGSYILQARAYDNTGAIKNTAIAITVKAAGDGNGLSGAYYNNKDFTSYGMTRVDPGVNFDWGEGTPDARIGSDEFSVRWTGTIKADFSGTYTFYTWSDDGVRLWVNNKLLVNNWTNHGAMENSNVISLTAGQKYPIKLEFYDNFRDAVIKLSWSHASVGKQIIPKANLYAQTIVQPPPTMEAENCGITSGTVNSNSSASGGKYVDFSSGGKLSCTINADGGAFDLKFRVKRPNSGTRRMGVYINNTKAGVISSSSSSFATQTVANVSLRSGSNTIEVRDTEGTSELDIDKLDFALSGLPKYGAEDFYIDAKPSIDNGLKIKSFSAAGVEFFLPSEGAYQLTVYTLSGEPLHISGHAQAGLNLVPVDLAEKSQGIYFLKLQTVEGTITRTFSLMRNMSEDY